MVQAGLESLVGICDPIVLDTFTWAVLRESFKFAPGVLKYPDVTALTATAIIKALVSDGSPRL